MRGSTFPPPLCHRVEAMHFFPSSSSLPLSSLRENRMAEIVESLLADIVALAVSLLEHCGPHLPFSLFPFLQQKDISDYPLIASAVSEQSLSRTYSSLDGEGGVFISPPHADETLK